MIRKTPQAAFLLSILALLLLTTPGIGQALAQAAKPTSANDLNAKFVVEWMRLTYANVKAETVNAPAASRVYAYAGITIYESVSQGLDGYVSLRNSIKSMPALPKKDADATYDWPTVANGALSTVIPYLLPSDTTTKDVAALSQKQAADRTKATSDKVVQTSLDYGTTIGKVLIEWMQADGYKDTSTQTYTLPTGEPWYYVPTSPGAMVVGAFWGKLRPYALEKSSQCNVPIIYKFSTEKDSSFYQQALEVKNTVNNLTKFQKDTVNFWVDTPGQTGAPAGHWIEIGNQLVEQFGLKLGKAAEMYAMLGIALGDAFIACWQQKYEAPLLRPQTYIQRYIQKTWQSFVITPPFPSYTSGHSSASVAASEVLTALFGATPFTDATHAKDEINIPARTYTTFRAAADEATISRLYGGIHYRFDNEMGQKQGECVGANVVKTIQLRAAQ
jgi:hypothetical protein